MSERPSDHEEESNRERQKKPNPQWEKPLIEKEIKEIGRTADELGIDKRALIEAFDNAQLEELSDEDWVRMINCDSRDTSWTIESSRDYLQKGPQDKRRNFDRIVNGMHAGDALPAPIVLYRENEPPYLIAGNSRLHACRGFELRPTVLTLRLKTEP